MAVYYSMAVHCNLGGHYNFTVYCNMAVCYLKNCVCCVIELFLPGLPYLNRTYVLLRSWNLI